MKTNEIADIIINKLSERHFIIFGTSISVSTLHECDVLGINSNEYIYEYEIKRSRSDFRADFKKINKHLDLKNRNSHRIFNKWVKGYKTKELIKSIKIPNRFYYVCEVSLIKLDEIPEYAGLIYVNKDKEFIEIKSAPLLHREKATLEIYKGISRILSQRIVYGCSYYSYKQNLRNETKTF